MCIQLALIQKDLSNAVIVQTKILCTLYAQACLDAQIFAFCLGFSSLCGKSGLLIFALFLGNLCSRGFLCGVGILRSFYEVCVVEGYRLLLCFLAFFEFLSVLFFCLFI